MCNQVTKYFEDNNLLPGNQHGFRAQRSTMTAWAEIQDDWPRNTGEKCKTAILLWDLSAAFDTLDPELMCKKLKAYKFVSNLPI